jgi:AcrR family transcriptional regulator
VPSTVTAETIEVVEPHELTEVPESLRERKKHATRRAIEDAAWELFGEQGYDATSVHDIAARADVAPRTFFRYFPSKDAVLFGELDEALETFREAFRQRPATEPLLTSMIAATDALAVRAQHDRAKTLERFKIQQSSGVAAFSEYARVRFLTVARELVLEREGDSPDADLRARLVAGLFTTVHTVANEYWMETGCAGDIHDVGDRCMSLLFSTLGAERPDPAAG